MSKICGYISVVAMIIIVMLIFFGSPLAIEATEQDTLAYLLENGYRQEEIVALDGYYNRKEQPKYYVEVYIEQEETPRIFAYDSSGNISQVK